MRCQSIAFTIFSSLSMTSAVFAQSTPPPGVTIPSETPGKVEQIIPQPTPLPTPYPTPPAPTVPILPPPQGESPPVLTLPSKETFFVKEIQIIGNSVLQAEITQLKQELENKNITFEQLLQLRSDITQLYMNAGYVTSGAFLPNHQDITSGVVKIQIVEGELEDIQISGLNRLKPVYVRSRIARGAGTPLNQTSLEQALQLLQIDPLIARVNAELTAGSTPGRNILKIEIQEAAAFHAGIVAANNQSPSIGAEQATIFIAHDNLLGFGDKFSAEYGITEGLEIYDISYSFPFNALDGNIGVRYSNNHSRIIEEDFRDLKIRSEAQTLALNIRQPITRTPNSEFALGLGLDLRRSQTFLLNNIPFSFSEGAEDGKSQVTVIRFSQDWVQRSANNVLAMRSQFSWGIDAFEATVNDTGTDGRFFSWLGQFQWVQKLSPRVLMLAKINVQLTGDSLLSLEKFSIGGVDTVRGYRQNFLVADNGVNASLEVRFPLTMNPNILQLVPFFDMGTAWNNRQQNPQPETLYSLGLGLRWQPARNFFLRLDYGVPLQNIPDRGDTLQDQGLYFLLRYQAF